MYTTPLMGFIDAHCLVFDGEEENKLSYTDVHQQFKDLVEKLLTGFLSDLGIVPEQFVHVVSNAAKTELNEFIITSILTVDDFTQFKAMMVKRNRDLTDEVRRIHTGSHTTPSAWWTPFLKDFTSRRISPPGSLAFNSRPRCLSTPPDAFELHPDVALGAAASGSCRRGGVAEPEPGAGAGAAPPGRDRARDAGERGGGHRRGAEQPARRRRREAGQRQGGVVDAVAAAGAAGGGASSS